jgi:hopene-associated glycosyltransferase HpnB
MMHATPVAALSLAAWLYLLFGRGFFWRAETAPPPPAPVPAFPSVVAVIPARDEAPVIGRAVASLLAQDYRGTLSVIVVDDHSRDRTAEAARAAARSAGAEDRLLVVAARQLPDGWTGKLWAESEGLARVPPETRYVLLTDADIAHHPGNVAELVARAEAGGLDLVSLMVKLSCRSIAERALIPAFVFFFAMLYPFAWASDPRRATAAAAGGCMLVRRSALERIGGLSRIRGTLIDDCALAAEVKRSGGPIWLGLSDRTVSLRFYPGPGDIWRMIARTAYTQLGYSPALLGATVLGMAVTYLAPPLFVFAGGIASWLALATWLLMSAAFVPMLRLYRRSPLWAPLLPAIALFYLGATLDSARRHMQGKGGEWKGRVHSRQGA